MRCNRLSGVLTLAAAAMAILVFTAVSADAAVISFLGSDEATAAAWRSTSVAKPSAFDRNGDNAYGNDGYYVTILGTGQNRPVTSDLPVYIGSVTDKYVSGGGGRFNDNGYPDFDNPTLPIGPSVADVNAGIFYAAETGPVEILNFVLAQPADFVLTIPLVGNQASHRPSALSVTQTVGGTATAAAVVPTPASNDAVNYLFFDVRGRTGDAFRVDINGPGAIHGIGGVAFEGVVIPEPSTLLVWSLLAALGIGWGAYRRKR